MILIKAYFLLCHTFLFRAFWLEHRTLRYCGIHLVTLSEKSNTFYISRTALPDGVFRRNRACTEYAFILLNYLPCKSRADIGVSSCKSRFFSAVISPKFRFLLNVGYFIRFFLKVGQTAKFCPTSASWTIRTIKTINQTAIFSSYLSYLTYSLSELSFSQSYFTSTFLMLFSLYDLKQM